MQRAETVARRRAIRSSKTAGGSITTAKPLKSFRSRTAITDGDSIVHFRHSDVIVTGDIFTTTQYPFIDVKNGGSVQGEIQALNFILDRTVYVHDEDGGTMIIPGHGRVTDEWEVAEYRDMLVIIRDRVQAMIKSGATLQQVLAARPTADYDVRYGATSGAVDDGHVCRSGLYEPEESAEDRTTCRDRIEENRYETYLLLVLLGALLPCCGDVVRASFLHRDL